MPNALLQHFEERLGHVLGSLGELVECESPTADAATTTELTTILSRHLDRIGFDTTLHPTAAGAHLVATTASRSAEPGIMVLGHVDTVWPRGTLHDQPFRVEDGRAFGPGIFDMKSGLAVLLAALEAIDTLGIRAARPIKVLLTCDEESGSATSRALIEKEASASAMVLVLEPSLPGGAAKTRRSGVGLYEIIARGVAAHAGLDPEKGVSAVTELAQQIIALDRLNDFRNGVTVNAGVIHGGTYENVIASEARARVDVRFRTAEQGREISGRIESLRPVLDRATLEIRGGINRPPLERTAGVAKLFDHAKKLAAEVGLTLGEGSSGGASDGNFTAARGIPTLDGLGVEGDGAHARYEHIMIADLPRRAALLTLLLTTTPPAFDETAQ